MNKLWMAALLLLAGCNQDTSANPVPTLPQVMEIGDSISLGYLPAVQKDLHGFFKTGHACGSGDFGICNNGSTETILKALPDYFTVPVDVVLFNSGIHDFTFDGPGCTNLRVPPGEYFENVSRIMAFLKTKAKTVIWVDTTTIPEGLCATPTMRDTYNQLAEQAARDHGAYRLHIVSKDHAKDGIHFTYEGYRLLGEQVSECVMTAYTGMETESCVIN